MLGKGKPQNQRDMFRPLLTDFIDMGHELVLLAEKIDWDYFESEFSKYYSHTGQPGMPIRFSVGCLMLKRLCDLGDETLARAWTRDPYMQYFTGEAHFCHEFPCDPSDFVHFRKRIGEAGAEKVFAHSVSLHGKDARGKQQMSDTTVQGNTTTFPTDAKLAKKVIDKCNKLASAHGVAQRQSYKRVSKRLIRQTYSSSHPKRRKKAKRALGKLRTIAGRLVREPERKLPEPQRERHREELALFARVLAQQSVATRTRSIPSTSPIPHVSPRARCAVRVRQQGGADRDHGQEDHHHGHRLLSGQSHDSRTIRPLLEQGQRLNGHLPKEPVYDRGRTGKGQVMGVSICIPKPPLKRDTDYQKRRKRGKFRRRAAIEPVIGHLKKHFRMQQNHLMGPRSSKINAMFAATGWNLKKLMEKLVEENLYPFFKTLDFQFFIQNA